MESYFLIMPPIALSVHVDTSLIPTRELTPVHAGRVRRALSRAPYLSPCPSLPAPFLACRHLSFAAVPVSVAPYLVLVLE